MMEPSKLGSTTIKGILSPDLLYCRVSIDDCFVFLFRGGGSFIYLFIYCHLYSVFSIVQCSNALYRL